MARTRLLLCAALSLALVAGWASPALASAGVPPVNGPIARGFDPPDQPWLPGHRGIDLLSAAGAPVVAAMGGRVVFAGRIANRGVIVVSHGETRTTYEPVASAVSVGETVSAGQRLGTLTEGHPCPGGTCLHLGWRRGETYLDPSELFEVAGLRLLASNAAALAAKLAAAREAALAEGASPGLLLRPVPGRIGSKFGMRLHPIFRVWRMHSGVDLSASCGTPIRAAANGKVIGKSYDSASGNRLTIDHGSVGGRHLITIYMHASGYSARSGQQVRRGEVIGKVGSTGWSTGCHLHFSVKLDGRLVNPARFL